MKRVTDYFPATPVKKVALPSPPRSQPQDKATAPSSSPVSAKSHFSKAVSSISSWNKDQWVSGLPAETKELLQLEIDTLEDSWLEVLRFEIMKPYFLSLKKFLRTCKDSQGPAIYPPENDIYSWSRLTQLPRVKVLILGQDPYHNVGQAHGLAFSVRPPTPAPPSLVNIYKELKGCFPETFQVPKHGSLVKWAHQGVLMLNACLTVEAHKANSHANKGWEQFTEEVVRVTLKKNPHIVIMAWGRPASLRVDKVKPGPQHLVLRSVHPSPLSASRGWFGTAHFKKANEWLEARGEKPIDWHLISIRK